MVPPATSKCHVTFLQDALPTKNLTYVWMGTVQRMLLNVLNNNHLWSVQKVNNPVKMEYVDRIVLVSMVVL